MKKEHRQTQTEPPKGIGCLSRRQFLFYSATAVSTVALSSVFPGSGAALGAEALFAKYPKKKIVALADLKQDTPIDFLYPNEDATYAQCFIVKLGEKAGGGVGPDKDIVAFSSLCTHMGGLLNKSYKPEHKVAGPCPSHLTTFDLTRHGMVVAGHAVESLPQIVLEARQGTVYATGVAGLIFGGATNPGV